MNQFADRVFINAHVKTMNNDQPEAVCVACKDGKTIFVGDMKEGSDYIGQSTEVIDLHGKTMLPGFSDNHLHLLGYGISLIEVDLSGITSIDQVIERIKERASETEDGKWILCRGWDQNDYIEDRYFNRYDLDQATTSHPVFARRICGHAAVVNSRGLEIAGICAETPNPGTGVIEKEGEGNEPNGILHEEAMNIAASLIPPYDFADLKLALSKAMQKAIQAGVTAVTTDDVQAAGSLQKCIELYRSIWEDAKPAVRAYLLVAGRFLDEALETGNITGVGDTKVKIGPLKLFQDGSLGARTAALMDPYTDKPDTCGILVHSQNTLNEVAAKAHAAGMQIGVHAIGDAAIVSTLEALEYAQKMHPRDDSRHRIIHYEIINNEILEKSIELGIIADIQPKFLTTDGGWLEKRLGEERSTQACAWKTILDAGIPAVGGSDCPVEPLDPILGIHAAVTRAVYSRPGISWMPQEKLSVDEAVALYTRDGAFGSFEESYKGQIKPEYLADYVVLNQDPWQIEPDAIKDIQVLMTIIDGEICFAK